MKEINIRLGGHDYAALAARAEASGRTVSGEAAELLRAALAEGERADRLEGNPPIFSCREKWCQEL